MHALTIVLTDFFARYPRVGGIFGLVIALAFGYLGFTTWQELQTMPQEPLALSLADAATAVRSSGQNQWVALDAVVWDCINIVQQGDRTSAISTDQGRSVLGLATFSGSGELTCDDLSSASASGILRPLSDGEYERLTSRGFDLSSYGNATARVALCTFCGRSNSLLLVILSGVMVLLGLAMYPLSLYLRRQRDRNEVRQGPIGLGAGLFIGIPIASTTPRVQLCAADAATLKVSSQGHPMKASSTSHIARFDTLISTVKLVTWIALIAFLLPGSIGRPADAAPPIQEDPPSRLPYDSIFDAPFLDKGAAPEETGPALTDPEYVNWSRLVFQSFRNQHDWEIFAARGDGSNQVNLSNNASIDSHPRLNRDGTRVVFASNRHGTFEIYAMNADGSGQTRLTNNTTDDVFPAWSPNGSKIAFQAYRDGQAEIYVMNANGSGQTRLTIHGEYDGQPAWSPDGTKIAFVRKQSGQYRIWVMNANGSNPQQRSGQPISEDPTWSPDGSKIAYDADGNNDGWQEIWLMDAGGGNQQPVYYPSQSNTDAWVFSWSPDGRYVAFTSISWVYQQGQWYWTRAYLDAWDSANPNDTIRLSNNGLDWYPDWRSLDWQAPLSQMQPLPAQSPSPFTVRWSGSDAGPAGLANYDVQVKDGAGGVWTNWHMATTATSASYSGVGGHTYTFRARARDNAGNVEVWPVDYDAITTVEALPPRTSVEALAPYSRHSVLVRWGGSDPGGSGIQSYDVQVRQGGGPWTDWRMNTTDTQATFSGSTGVEQGFRVRARDYAQNLEPWPAGADATSVLYTWGIAGHATDNRGVPVVGMETMTTPAAFHTTPSNGEGAYAAHVSTEAASYTVNWSKPGYGALPGTTFASNLDASFDVVMPPVDNVVQNWGFENGSTSWQFGGGLTRTITNSVQHSGAAAAFLGSTAHPLRSVATLVSPLRGWNDQVESGIDAASVMHAVWIGLDNRVTYSSKPPGRSWTVPEPLTGPPAHTSGSVALHVDDAGAVHVVWCAADDVYYRQKPSDAGWSVPERIVGSGDSWYQPALTTTIDGVVKVAWSSGGILRFAQRRPGGGWSAIQGFGTGGWFGRLIKIVADSSGRAHMMWVAGDGSGTGTVDIFHAVQNLDGSWSPTINLSEYDNHAFEGDLVVDSDGTAHAVWGADGVYYRMRPAAAWKCL